MRLTAAGRVVLGGSIVLFVAAWRLGYTELNVVVAAGILAVALASAWTLVRPRVDLERVVAPPRVVRGDPAVAQVTVRSAEGRGLPALQLRDHVAGEPVDVVLPRLAAGQVCETSYDLPTNRRGVVEIGPLSVVRQDPFGLTRATAKRNDTTETLWVYPRIHQVTPLSSGRRRDLDGPTHDGASGSITFHALREYVNGDDLRLIHWRSTARTGTLMVRQQADPSQPQTTIVLDTHAASYEGDSFEDAVDAVASLVVASTSRRFPVRLLSGGGLVTSGTGRSGRSDMTSGAAALLEYLTPLQPGDDATLGQAAMTLSGQPGGNSLVVVTGNPDPRELMALETLRSRYLTLAVLRFQPEAQPGMSWSDGVVDLVTPDAKTFAALWNEKA